MTTDTFVPRWASPTGDTIRDVMAARGIEVDQLPEIVGLDATETAELLAGRAPLRLSVAQALAGRLGSTVQFWMSRDGQYHEDLRRLRDHDAAEALPTQFMAQSGWMRSFANWADRVRALREFFDVPSGKDLTDATTGLLAGARLHRSNAHRLDDPALAVWFRRAESIVADHPADSWDPDRLRREIPALRALTRLRDPQKSLGLAAETLASCGVRLAVMPAPPGCPVGGAARRDVEGVRMLLLSGRHLTDDHLWFTFFHELGHLLAGDETQVCADPRDDPDEVESPANVFASDLLVPPGALEGLTARSGYRDVIRAASAIGVSPGIVLGQLQFRGIVPYGRLERAKRRFEWDGDRLTLRDR